MSKKSRRVTRRNRAPREVRYSASGNTRLDVYDDGSREVWLASGAAAALTSYVTAARSDFEQRFGRPPRDDDPLFYDPDAPEPRPIDEDAFIEPIAQAMLGCGIAPAYVHAFRRTGMLLSEQNYTLFSPEELAEFAEAMEEYAARS